MSLEELLRRAVIECKASDIHLKPGLPPMIRINGVVNPMPGHLPLNEASIASMAEAMLSRTSTNRPDLESIMTLETAHEEPGLGRFRVSIFRQRRTLCIVMRFIPARIPTFEELHLPPVVRQAAGEHRGLVLVTGMTGSGKSTTLAALIQEINQTRPCTIITIEDPIEYVFREDKAIIYQREIGQDVPDFATALKEALRQDPDVIMVGEMRDLETIKTALTAAETGHLVLSTLHTLDAVETVNRIITEFPERQQAQVRRQLASVLKAVFSMRLIPQKGGGRVPAVEALVTTASVREAITDPDKTSTIRDLIASGKATYKTQTFDQALQDLIQAGLITEEEALKHCSNAENFRLSLQGISVGGGGATFPL